ncbi:hypothetical protein JOC94_000501 [Bacillus thermophilus]|uniref:Transposase n=1 Tax=Siminovitchia thermophila TaxID=1245522 RepID=A0ABS2R3R5_9BACI|nr:hypothetical protein [Siminovitchia thermophila]
MIVQDLGTFDIKLSLFEKGAAYDNAVAEATIKIIKAEFVSGRVFPCQQLLEFDFLIQQFSYRRIVKPFYTK